MTAPGGSRTHPSVLGWLGPVWALLVDASDHPAATEERLPANQRVYVCQNGNNKSNPSLPFSTFSLLYFYSCFTSVIRDPSSHFGFAIHSVASPTYCPGRPRPSPPSTHRSASLLTTLEQHPNIFYSLLFFYNHILFYLILPFVDIHSSSVIPNTHRHHQHRLSHRFSAWT